MGLEKGGVVMWEVGLWIPLAVGIPAVVVAVWFVFAVEALIRRMDRLDRIDEEGGER